jgi:hypothetical protein
VAGACSPWFLFDQPFLFSSQEQRDQAKRACRQWQEAHRKTSGFQIDSTHELSRVMRLAGTRNFMGGGEGVPVKIVEDVGPRYGYAKLAALVSNIAVTASSNGMPVQFNGKVPAERLQELVADLCARHPGFSERWKLPSPCPAPAPTTAWATAARCGANH